MTKKSPTTKPRCITQGSRQVARDVAPMTGADWTRRYYSLPMAEDLRLDKDDADPWTADLEATKVLKFALSRNDRAAYRYTMSAVKEHLPEPIADAITAIGKYAESHANDYRAGLAFEGAVYAALHYRQFARTLAAFAEKDAAHA